MPQPQLTHKAGFSPGNDTKTKATLTIQRVFRKWLAEKYVNHLKEIRKQNRLNRLRENAATAIQSGYRSFMARSAIEEIHNISKGDNQNAIASLIIQRVWRGHSVRRSHKTKRQSEKKGTTKIDSAATELQAAWRGYSERKLLSSRETSDSAFHHIIVVEHLERDLLFAEEERSRQYLLIRIHEQLLAIDAATAIQRTYRKYYAGTRASTVQSFCRTKLDINKRSELHEKKSKKLELAIQMRKQKSAKRIQQFWRRRRQVIKANVIQRGWKCHAARVKVRTRREEVKKSLADLVFEAENIAATKVQTLWRGCKSRRLVNKMRRSIQNKAAVKIQNAIRTWFAKKAVAKYRQERITDQKNTVLNESCSRIQSTFRGYRVRKLLNEWQEQLQQHFEKAALIIQRNTRGYLTRIKRSQYVAAYLFRKKNKAVLTLQRAYRRYSANKLVRAKELEQLNELHTTRETEAATTIQSFIRGQWDRQSVQHIKDKLKAVEKLQHWVRYWTPVKKCRNHANAIRKRLQLKAYRVFVQGAANMIQSSWRGHYGRLITDKKKEYREELYNRSELLQRQKWAALEIERCYRGHLGRLVNRQLLKRKHSSLTIQCCWRRYLARRWALRLQLERYLWTLEMKRRQSAITIQRFARGWMTRTLTSFAKALHDHRKESALAIQLAWRTYQARREVSRLRDLREKSRQNQEAFMAVLNVQRLIRGWRCRAKKLAIDRMHQQAAGRIARKWLTRAALRHKERLKQEKLHQQQVILAHASATRIQSLWRGYVIRNKVLPSLKIQRSLHNTRLRRKEWACKIIQRMGRGMSQRLLFYPMYYKQHAAAVKIQTIVRGFMVRLKLKRAKELSIKMGAAKKIQNEMKAWFTDLQLRRAEHEMANHKLQIKLRALQRLEADSRSHIIMEQNETHKMLNQYSTLPVKPKKMTSSNGVVKLGDSEVTYTQPSEESDGLFLKAWFDWMQKMRLPRDHRFERLFMKEASGRRNFIQTRAKEIGEMASEFRRMASLISMRHTEYGQAWRDEQNQLRSEWNKKLHSAKKEAHQNMDPEWTRACLELDRAYDEMNASKEISSLWLPREHVAKKLSEYGLNGLKVVPKQASVRKLVSSANKRSRSVRLPAIASNNNSEPLQLKDASGTLQPMHEVLLSNASHVEVLELRAKGLEDSALLPILMALKTNTVVSHLYLDDNSLTDVSGIELANILQYNTSLTTVTLCGNNQITDLTAKHLLNALKVNTTITALGLEGTQITSTFAAQLTYLVTYSAQQAAAISKYSRHPLIMPIKGVSVSPNNSLSLPQPRDLLALA